MGDSQQVEMMVVLIQPFLGGTERTLPRSRPASRNAGRQGGSKARSGTGATRSEREHGEDPPFDAPEHPAPIHGKADFPLPLPVVPYSRREAKAGSPSKSSKATTSKSVLLLTCAT